MWLIVLTVFASVKCFFQVSAGPVTISDISDVKPFSIQEVPFGETVTLLCQSNDDKHNFLYWHVNKKNIIVGPGNEEYDNYKFKYEVLSGKLTIKAVSEAEDGIYNCVSRGVRKDDFNIRSVRMVVRKDFEEVFEHDPGLNLLRTVVVIFTLAVLAGIGYVAYRIYKNRFRHPSYLVPSDDEEEEEDSGEELFRAPNTARAATKIVISDSDERLDGPGISTDFRSILDNTNNK